MACDSILGMNADRGIGAHCLARRRLVDTETWSLQVETPHITDLDRRRLEMLLDAVKSNAQIRREADSLRDRIDMADVVPSERIPADVVTMNSIVRYEDEPSRRVREVTPVYPEEADPSAGMVSILSPLGNALLGLRVGQHSVLRLPTGEERRIRVLAVVYQPEAADSLAER